MEEERRKGKERGKVEIGKGSEVAFTDFDDFLLKLVVGAWVFVTAISISTPHSKLTQQTTFLTSPCRRQMGIESPSWTKADTLTPNSCPSVL